MTLAMIRTGFSLRTWSLALACLLVGVAVAAAPRPAAADAVADAKALYLAASYEEALAALGTSDTPEAHEYRSLCLLALGRLGEAERAVEALVTAAPALSLTGDERPPRFVTLFTNTRKRVLPDVARRLFTEARTQYQAKAYARAQEHFALVLRLTNDPVMQDNPDASDLRLLAAGFADLLRATETASAAAPAAAPAPASATAGATPSPAGGAAARPASGATGATTTAVPVAASGPAPSPRTPTPVASTAPSPSPGVARAGSTPASSRTSTSSPPASAPGNTPAAATGAPAPATTTAAAPPAAAGGITPARTVDIVHAKATRLTIPPLPTTLAALNRTLSGSVKLRIGADGRVLAASMEVHMHPQYDLELLAAARHWEFTPARLNGKPIEAEQIVPVEILPRTQRRE